MALATASPTAFSPPVLNGFHFYGACGESVAWNSEWYTAPFFTASSAYYDSLASTGQVEPPTSVILTESACQALQSSVSLAVAVSSKASVSAALLSSASAASAASSSALLAESGSRSSPSSPSATSSPAASNTASASLAPAATPSNANALPGQPSSTSTCAGAWVPQAKSATAAAVWSVVAGAAVWLAFALVRGRTPTLYEARRWFVPAESRPLPVHASLLSFFFPPVPLLPPLGSPQTTDAHLHIHTLFTALRLVGLWTATSLAAALPLYTVGIPCLAVGRGRSAWGGVTGSLTDLSLLRLLDALDPAELVPTSSTSLLALGKRAESLDPQSDVRTRLLILTVLVPLVAVCPALVLILRAFSHAAQHRARFLADSCGGLELVWLPFAREGLGEEALREVLMDGGLWQEGDDPPVEREAQDGRESSTAEPGAQVAVRALAGVPDTAELDALIAERFAALDRLEESEQVYIASFEVKPADAKEDHAAPSSSRSTDDSYDAGASPPRTFLAPAQYYRVDAGSAPSTPLPSPVLPALRRPNAPERVESTSRFREVERDSGFFGGRTGKLEPGTRLRDDADLGLVFAAGTASSDDSGTPRARSSPETEGSHSHSTRRPSDPDSPRTPVQVARDPSTSPASRGLQAFPWRTDAPAHLDLPDEPDLRLAPGRSEAALARAYQTIVESRGELKRLNDAVAHAQARALDDVAVGRGLHGFILIGRGVRHIDGAELIEGHSTDDIVWAVLQKGPCSRSKRALVRFWLAVAVIGALLAAACFPFLALMVAPAPGVSRYIDILRHLSTRSDLGAALVFGLVPALAITLFISLAVALIERAARAAGFVSITRRRRAVLQAVWLVVLVVCGGWLLACSSILFATAALNENSAESVTVADGSIYSSAFFLVFLVNLALIAPGLQLLQPRRLYSFLRTQRRSATPRQRFRASRPASFKPTFSEVTCLLACFYSAAFSFLFPLLGLPAFVLLLLSLVALRYLVFYVYAQSSGGQSGGEDTLWLLARFGFIISLTPLLLGLILASRRLWSYAAGMLAVALFALLLVEIVTSRARKRPARRSLPSDVLAALQSFDRRLVSDSGRGASAEPARLAERFDDDAASGDRRTSLSSILVLLDQFNPASRTVRHQRLPLPLKNEAIDDMVSTELAAATHPQAPPHLLDDPADSLRPLCYPPSVVQPPPTVWLAESQGQSRVGRREAIDLDRYHGLPAITTSH